MKYCKNCKWYDKYQTYVKDSCWIYKERDFYGNKLYEQNNPIQKNKNCDCLDYKRKWWKILC
jgi:hypothetical protein